MTKRKESPLLRKSAIALAVALVFSAGPVMAADVTYNGDTDKSLLQDIVSGDNHDLATPLAGSRTASVTGNNVTVTGTEDAIPGSVFGGFNNADASNVTNNTVNINATTSAVEIQGNVWGGLVDDNATTGASVNQNTVKITGHATNSILVGGTINLSGTITEDITQGTVAGAGSTVGNGTSNQVHIDNAAGGSVTVGGNVSGSTTGATNLDVTSGVVFGNHAVNNSTGNSVTIDNVDGTVAIGGTVNLTSVVADHFMLHGGMVAGGWSDDHITGNASQNSATINNSEGGTVTVGGNVTVTSSTSQRLHVNNGNVIGAVAHMDGTLRSNTVDINNDGGTVTVGGDVSLGTVNSVETLASGNVAGSWSGDDGVSAAAVGSQAHISNNGGTVNVGGSLTISNINGTDPNTSTDIVASNVFGSKSEGRGDGSNNRVSITNVTGDVNVGGGFYTHCCSFRRGKYKYQPQQCRWWLEWDWPGK